MARRQTVSQPDFQLQRLVIGGPFKFSAHTSSLLGPPNQAALFSLRQTARARVLRSLSISSVFRCSSLFQHAAFPFVFPLQVGWMTLERPPSSIPLRGRCHIAC